MFVLCLVSFVIQIFIVSSLLFGDSKSLEIARNALSKEYEGLTWTIVVFWKSEMFRFFGTVVNLCVYMYILEIYWAMADADMCKLRKAFLNAIIKSVAFKSFYSKSLHRSTKPVTMLILSFRRNLVGSAKSNSCILIACIFSNLTTCR